MLTATSKYEKPMIYASIEHVEDLYINVRLEENEYLEEDKNYDVDSSFTFNSHEVVNTLVSFIDIWFKWKFSKNLALGFYSTNSHSKERNTNTSITNNIILPEKSIISLLMDRNYGEPNLLDSVKKFIIAEYKKQYNDPNHVGHIELIENLSDKDWISFLNCIDWQFGKSNEVDKKDEVLGMIKKCRFFNHSLENKEELVLSLLMEVFDSRQNLSDLTEKFVHSSDIELAFKQCEGSGIGKEDDPVWELWSKISPSDSRNIKDKIEAVCSDYSQRKIEHFALMVSRSLLEQQRISSDKTILSIKYRVYEHCQSLLIDLLASRKDKLTDKEIDEILSSLNQEAKKCIQLLSKEYKYSVMNDKLIDGLILELFDSCFLAFD